MLDQATSSHIHQPNTLLTYSTSLMLPPYSRLDLLRKGWRSISRISIRSSGFFLMVLRMKSLASGLT